MANKERYTVAEVVAAVQATKGMKAQAARQLGCQWKTIDNYAKRHPTVAAAISQAREEMKDTAELKLYSAILDGEAWAICFFLKTQGKERGYIEKSEVEVLLKRELETMMGVLEEILEPDVFRVVVGELARIGR